jgi:hypothetical protein
MDKTQNQNRTIIKILGSIHAVRDVAAKIETLFPLYVESPIKMNDDGHGCHIFITVPGSPRQENPETASQPAPFSFVEAANK